MKKTIKIGLLSQGGRGWIGGSLYIKNIILALSHLPDETKSTFEICFLDDSSVEGSTGGEFSAHLNHYYNLKTAVKPLTLKNRLMWRIKREMFKAADARLAPLVHREGIDFLYPHFVSKREKFPARSCPWIADFQHRHMPHLFSEAEFEGRDKAFSEIAINSPTVVLSSQSAAKDFHQFFPESNTEIEILQFRTTPSPEWYSSSPVSFQAKYHLPEKFFLISNQFWQHKNHMLVFEALRLLQKKNIYPTVVCTGHIHDHRKPDYSDQILQMIHIYNLGDQIFLLGLIPRNDQIQLMRRSIAVIQPSLFEGWSTIVEDARCLGKRMILSDFPVHIEQDPPSCAFFERNNPEDLADTISRWWKDFVPGPDFDGEALAKARNFTEVQEFGYHFLEIARKSQLISS